MITAERLRRCCSGDDAFALLRELGYEVSPIAIAAAGWRRAGIEILWGDNVALHLAARTPQLDVYVIAGDELPDSGAITAFLRSLTTYNALVKPVALGVTAERLTVHDLSARREPRRLDVDLSHPTAHALDRLNLLASGCDPLRIFDRALDRESLTRQFFERFRRAVREVSQAIRAAVPAEPPDTADGQALLLLSRLLFLYFIQQKGWLNGERRFLVDRIEAAVREKRGVYATLYEPLFLHRRAAVNRQFLHATGDRRCPDRARHRRMVKRWRRRDGGGAGANPPRRGQAASSQRRGARETARIDCYPRSGLRLRGLSSLRIANRRAPDDRAASEPAA